MMGPRRAVITRHGWLYSIDIQDDLTSLTEPYWRIGRYWAYRTARRVLAKADRQPETWTIDDVGLSVSARVLVSARLCGVYLASGLRPGVGAYMAQHALDALRVGFSGTRHGMARAQAQAVSDLLFIELAPVCELHHGDCVGADADTDLIAHSLEIATVVHPPYRPEWRAWCKNAAEYRPPKEYLSRNVDIVDETDVLVAAPYRETGMGGTWFSVRYARRQGRPLAIVYRSGWITWERLGEVR